MSLLGAILLVIGVNVAWVVGTIALNKRNPSLFTAPKPEESLVPTEVAARLLPPAAPPLPDVDMPTSLKTDLDALLIAKHDYCRQYNHSCDVCVKHDLNLPSLCSYDNEFRLVIEQQAETFDTRMGSLLEIMIRNEALAQELNEKLEIQNVIMDEQQYVKRRFAYTLLFGAISLAMNFGLWSYMVTLLQGVIP